MATYVLVPGAWLGGWVWRDVASRLRERGHDVYPVTLTGLGERAHLARPDIDVDTHVTDVVNVLSCEDLRGVVLVGHSAAGVVVTCVADRAPERLAALAYVDTGPLPPGQALIDLSPPEARAEMRRQVAEQGGGWRLPFPSLDRLGTRAAVAGLGDAELALMQAGAVGQPFATFTQPMRCTLAERPPYGRSVILCGGFGLDAEQFRQIVASGDPRFRAFAAPDWRFEELATGHWPMLSAPGELAALLDRLAAGT